MSAIERLRALLTSATPGPWAFVEPHSVMAPLPARFGYATIPVAAIEGLFSKRHRNGALIAEGINALPALLDEREALRAALKDAIGQLQAHPNGYHHCRWCSGVDRHDATCAWVARNEVIAAIQDAARAALDRLEGAL